MYKLINEIKQSHSRELNCFTPASHKLITKKPNYFFFSFFGFLTSFFLELFPLAIKLFLLYLLYLNYTTVFIFRQQKTDLIGRFLKIYFLPTFFLATTFLATLFTTAFLGCLTSSFFLATTFLGFSFFSITISFFSIIG